MGLFDRDEERYRGRGGYDRDMGRGTWDRVEQSFRGRDPNDLGMRGSNRGYGGEYGPRGDRYGHHGNAGGYDREMRGDDRNFLERTGEAVRRGWNDLTDRDYDRAYRGRGGYDAGYGMTGGGMNPGAGGWSRGYGADYGRGMHGSDFGSEGRWGRGVGYDPGFPRDRGGYDRHEYKSRHQTDAGDPYGDRQSRTPIRMVNEDYAERLARRNAYDADVRRDRDWF
jgi:hypothetical protein